MQPNPDLYSKNCTYTQLVSEYALTSTQFTKDNYASVMDLGCGTGEVTTIILKTVKGIKEVIAVDKEPAMVAFAKKHNSHQSITYDIGDIIQFNSSSDGSRGRFDLVTSFFAFHWLDDPKLGLKSIHEVLKPGGEFLVVQVVAAPGGLMKVAEEMREHPAWKHYVKDYPLEYIHTPISKEEPASDWRSTPLKSYEEMTRAEGLEIINVTLPNFEYAIEGEHCRALLELLAPYTKAIPDEKKEEYLTDAFRVFYDASPNTADGRKLWDDKCIIVHGQKVA